MVAYIEVKFLEMCSKLEDEFAELLRIWSISLNARTTRRDYHNYVYEFITFIRKTTWREPCLDDLNHTNISLAYVSYLRKKHTKDDKGGYCSTTAVTKMAAIRGLYKTAYKHGFIDTNPMAYAPSIKATEGDPSDILEESEVLQLLSYMDALVNQEKLSPLKKYTHNMYRTMFYVILGTGMRVNSAVNLRIKDFRGNSLSIYEKRGKTHNLKINEQTVQTLKFWIETFKPLSRETDFVFTSRDLPFKSLSEKGFGQGISKYVKACGIEKNITPHSFRGTVISLLHWQGVEGRRIQSLMGHKSYSTTLRYLNRADEIKNPVTDYLVFENEKE